MKILLDITVLWTVVMDIGNSLNDRNKNTIEGLGAITDEMERLRKEIR